MGIPQRSCICGSKKLIRVVSEPEDATVTLSGKLVSALQTGVTIEDGAVTGTLNYVTGYTGYSSDESEQEGNYLALKFESNADSVELTYGEHSETLDEDMNAVIRVTDVDEPLTVTATRQGNTETMVLDFSGLTLVEE